MNKKFYHKDPLLPSQQVSGAESQFGTFCKYFLSWPTELVLLSDPKKGVLFMKLSATALLLSTLTWAQSNLEFSIERNMIFDSCRDTVVGHGGTIDSSCMSSSNQNFGCYDIVETVCYDNRNRETSRNRKEVMNGKCGNSYSDCW